jgi:hypothetical protein
VTLKLELQLQNSRSAEYEILCGESHRRKDVDELFTDHMFVPFLLEDAFPVSEGTFCLHKSVVESSDLDRILAQLLA